MENGYSEIEVRKYMLVPESNSGEISNKKIHLEEQLSAHLKEGSRFLLFNSPDEAVRFARDENARLELSPGKYGIYRVDLKCKPIFCEASEDKVTSVDVD